MSITKDETFDDSRKRYDDYDLDEATLLELNSDISDMIKDGKYDEAEELVTNRLEDEPSNNVLHRMALQIQNHRQLTPDFPADSEASKRLKKRFLRLIKQAKPQFSHVQHLKYTEMLFNKYFYFIEYSDEVILNSLIREVPDFNLFKNN